MNCKPGDLAILVRAPDAMCERLTGRIYRLIGPCHSGAWKYEGPEERGRSHSTRWSVCCFADVDLRPIRDPGDEAQDESFRWAPAPEKVTA